jgi:putative membrane protein
MRLSDDDRHRIQAAVAAAEKRAGVHIATSIVPASDRYAMYPLVWGSLNALLAGGVMALFFPAMSLRESFAIEAIVFVALSLLFDWWPIRLMLVPRHICHARASNFAHREFAARILGPHGQQGGVLLFVSLGERYVEVIGDNHTHVRVGEQGWKRIVHALVSAAKDGHHADGVVRAVEECAAQIVAHPAAT